MGLISINGSHFPRLFLTAGGVLVLTVFALLAGRQLSRPRVPVPDKGYLDLRSWDFRRGAIPLGGTWEFVDEELVPGSMISAAKTTFRRVPDTRFSHGGGFFSGTGGGTYRLRIQLPQDTHSLGLRLSTIRTASEVEVDGQIVARVGFPSEDREREVPAIGLVDLSLSPSTDNFDLVIRVSNHQFRWGGIVLPPLLGPLDILDQAKKRDERLSLLLTGILAGTALFTLIFFFFRRKDKAFLSFSVFTILVIIRSLTTGDQLLAQLAPAIGFVAFVRIQHLSMFLMLPSAIIFFATLFPDDISLSERRVFLIIATLPLVLIPWASVPVLSWSLLVYFFIAMGLLGYGYWAICIRLVLLRRPMPVPRLMAGTVLLGILLVTFGSGVIEANAESELPWGAMGFVLLQAVVLAYRSTRAFDQTERLTVELKHSNQALTAETRKVEEAYSQVELSLAEKEVLLREVHHRVKNSLQIVLSIISLEAHRAINPEVQNAYDGIRDRIRAISLVHDRLYGLESEQRMDLCDYLRELISHLGESFGENPVLFDINGLPVLLPMDFCLDIGLVVTELVINSYRHGQRDGTTGVVRVRLDFDGQVLRLEVADDGPGFPKGFIPESANSVGFKIVSTIIHSRHGRLLVSSDSGARVEVAFGPLFSSLEDGGHGSGNR
jgi:two-component sensor histidine kinase